MEYLDDLMLAAYSKIPRPVKNQLNEVIKDGMKTDEDEDVPEVFVHVHGNLGHILKALNKEITILDIELAHPGARRYVRMLEAVVDNCPKLKVLKTGFNALQPIKLDLKSEKKFIAVIQKLLKTCPKLEHWDMRDIVISRSMYNVVGDMFQLKSLSANVEWDELLQPSDTICRDMLNKKFTMLRKLDLLCFKQYAPNAPGPDLENYKMLTVPREGYMCGLSAWINTNDFMWVFNCDRICYLDLEIDRAELLKPSAAEIWNQFKLLSHLKLVSTKVSGVPPLKDLHTLTHLILDIKIPEKDFKEWYEPNMPDSLEFAAFFGVKMLTRQMFCSLAKTPVLKALYIGYSEDNPDAVICPVNEPPTLEHLMMLKNNNFNNKSEHHVLAARFMKKQAPKLKFKLDGYEKPKNRRMTVVFKDFLRRLHIMRTRPVVLDWRIPVLRNRLFDFLDCEDVTADMLEELDQEEVEEEEGGEEGGMEGNEEGGLGDESGGGTATAGQVADLPTRVGGDYDADDEAPPPDEDGPAPPSPAAASPPPEPEPELAPAPAPKKAAGKKGKKAGGKGKAPEGAAEGGEAPAEGGKAPAAQDEGSSEED